jgi:hypothetical protein
MRGEEMTRQNQFIEIPVAPWLAIAAIIVVGLIGTQSAFAQEEQASCTLATLNGMYIFDASGFTALAPTTTGPTALPTVWTPKAVVESLRLNGDGALSAVSTASVGGTLVGGGEFHNATGIYTVNPNCTGTLAFNPQGQGPRFDIFIAPRGTTFHMIQTGPSNVLNVLAGESRRVSR